MRSNQGPVTRDAAGGSIAACRWVPLRIQNEWCDLTDTELGLRAALGPPNSS